MAYTRARPIIAAAGGVDAANAAAYAEAGADVLVTSSPYQAKPKDVQVRITAADAPMFRSRQSSDMTSGSPTATAAQMVGGR
jgi:molybdenum transport protein